ncbi:hypothetical protein E2C01_052401 [Portunus trituberculatus]|uniref:Uncharacterized protein n=1 Tax=Portunus trituberculatus TaxID=210409 RepID=A0A5B7GMD4_PORTR|nr:hypothetical protein [Portunus trituberculatus]
MRAVNGRRQTLGARESVLSFIMLFSNFSLPIPSLRKLPFSPFALLFVNYPPFLSLILCNYLSSPGGNVRPIQRRERRTTSTT